MVAIGKDEVHGKDAAGPLLVHSENGAAWRVDEYTKPGSSGYGAQNEYVDAKAETPYLG